MVGGWQACPAQSVSLLPVIVPLEQNSAAMPIDFSVRRCYRPSKFAVKARNDHSRDGSVEKGCSHVSGKSSLKFLSLSLLALLAGCNSSSPTGGLSFGQPTAQQPAVTPVVQAYCPQVVLRDDTAVRSAYVGNATADPDKLLYRASMADATRACTANESTLTITVMAQGRLVLGAAGKPGPTNLPVTVEVVDGDNVIYTQTVNFSVDVPAEGFTQFLFSKNDVAIPNSATGASRFTRVRLGFEEPGAARTTRPKRR